MTHFRSNRQVDRTIQPISYTASFNPIITIKMTNCDLFKFFKGILPRHPEHTIISVITNPKFFPYSDNAYGFTENHKI